MMKMKNLGLVGLFCWDWLLLHVQRKKIMVVLTNPLDRW